MRYNVLVVDDDLEISLLIKSYLKQHDFTVYIADNTQKARTYLYEKNVHAIILDVMMPNEDGITFCKYLRDNETNTPILMLSALGESADKTIGLDQGADDYLSKPFSPRELLARVNSLIRRSYSVESIKQISKEVKFNDWIYNPQLHYVTNIKTNVLVSLSSSESKLLSNFLTHPRQVFSRSQIATEVFMKEFNALDRSVDMQITRLRKKLNDSGIIIHTERGQGYSFRGYIREEDA